MMPTGFRFNPTDEELIEILERKVSAQEMPLHSRFIVQRNVYDHDPQHLQWDNTVLLPSNERYCYCIKENDSREVSGQGWWKATGHTKKICANDNKEAVVGYKRPLTFHRYKDGQRNRNEAIKTNWIMHEFSLHNNNNNTTDWRLCKIKHKGKPSAQEELENIRNQIIGNQDLASISCSSSSSMIHTQPEVFDGNPATDHHYYDPFMPVIGADHSYTNGDYQQLDHQEYPSEQQQVSSSLWSWSQNNY